MTKLSRTAPRPTEAELELLRILWEKEPATVRDIYDALNLEKTSGYTTVLKLLQIMTAKGLVIRDEANRAHVYRSAFTQDAMQSKILRDLSVRLFSGSAAQLALHALSMEPASENELEEIRALIERKRSSGLSATPEEASARERTKPALTRLAQPKPIELGKDRP
jgi:BlaI family transcriptional regulator, penicillinase repressor